MKKSYLGQCSCGNAKIIVKLPLELTKMQARQCDCDFCVSRGISYLSDAEGELQLSCDQPLLQQTQGSNQAQFLTCSNCQTVVAVVFRFKEGLRGALNATLLADAKLISETVAISPKLLDADEKRRRWEKVWLTVKVQGNCH